MRTVAPTVTELLLTVATTAPSRPSEQTWHRRIAVTPLSSLVVLLDRSR